jgi:hypothetical protein
MPAGHARLFVIRRLGTLVAGCVVTYRRWQGGKVESAINEVFERLERGEVPGRMALQFE